jgi:hypothetical protein
MGDSSLKNLLTILLFYVGYVFFLNIFDFISGTPEITSKAVTSGWSILNIIGLGTYGDIPMALTFIITTIWLSIITYFIYETVHPTK